ncbi:MAG: amidohydrolase [Clostridiaceae bacterium]|jgi:amidohydrolase|nr:amidohydrolase [Clostridiaceae bacterium]
METTLDYTQKALEAVDQAYIISLRREFHEHPEVGFDLPNTLDVVRRELTDLEVTFTEEYGRSAIVAYINRGYCGVTIGLRADMDALPLTERTGLPFSSKIEGRMHACGHDAHTAMLLGTAKALKSVEKQLACTVALIFQPSEEGPLSGAELMVRDGLMKEIDFIIALHVENLIESGRVGISPGVALAGCLPIELKFFGKTAHATMAHSGVNALAMAVNTYVAIQNMMSTQMNPLTKYVCSIGVLESGTTHNVIPDHATMKISLRTFDQETEQFFSTRIRQIAENAAAQQGGRVEMHEGFRALPVVNDPVVSAAVVRAAEKIIGKDHVVEVPVKLGSEDFSCYIHEKPGAFVRLGTRNKDKGCVTLPHNNDFLIDEDALSIGSKVCVQFVLDNMHGLDF